MIRILLVVFFILSFLAIRNLPWWVSLSIGLAIILLGKYFAAAIFHRLIMWPFRAKGKVLRGASVEVHSVKPIPRPVDFDDDRLIEDDELDENNELYENEAEVKVPRDFFEIEVTITPQPSTGPFYLWDYHDITLGAPEQPWNSDDDTCVVYSVQRVRNVKLLYPESRSNGEAETSLSVRNVGPEELDDEEAQDDEFDDSSKVPGPQRLKMTIGVNHDVRELVFMYYLEKFGRLSL